MPGSNGFTGTFFIEPKPCEPSKHQYDYDSETVIGFLRQYDLLNDFKINIEVNHATLAGHTFQHEMQVLLMPVCWADGCQPWRLSEWMGYRSVSQ